MRKKRLSKYFGYLGLSIIIPFLTIAFSIAFTGEREKGIVTGLIIACFALLIQNSIYSFYLLKASGVVNLISGAVVTIVSIGLAYLSLYYEVKLQTDFYGLWTSLLVFAVSSIILWELLYHLIGRNKVR